MRGKFITLEGIEGAGKSSSMREAIALLKGAGLDLYSTREPGGTPLAEALRELLLTPTDEVIAPSTELLLMFAARSQHVRNVLDPKLEAGQWVLCDRFTDATYAYQGDGRGMARSAIRWLEDFAQGGLRPDLTLLLDVEPAVGLARARGGEAGDRFEREDIEFFARVRQGYLRAAKQEPKRFHVIDAGQSQPQVLDQVRWVLSSYLESLHP